MKRALVKVCCISSLTEAKLALQAGADLLGLVSEMPSGPGVISLEKIAGIVRALPAETRTVLLTSKLNCRDILDQHNLVKTWGIQIVDNLPLSELEMLRQSRPNKQLIQVIHIRDKSSVSEALSYENLVDYILLDSGNPGAKLRTLGGTGAIHDWTISREVCLQIAVPVFLAGGLQPDNIVDAQEAVHPFGFDVCSGVRTDGNLDPKKLAQFIRAVHDHAGQPQ